MPNETTTIKPSDVYGLLKRKDRNGLVRLHQDLMAELGQLDGRRNALEQELRKLRRFTTREKALAKLDETRAAAVLRYTEAIGNVRWSAGQPGMPTVPDNLPALRALATDDGLWQDIAKAVEAPAGSNHAEVFGQDPIRLAELEAEHAAVEERRREIRGVLQQIPRDVAREAGTLRMPTVFEGV